MGLTACSVFLNLHYFKFLIELPVPLSQFRYYKIDICSSIHSEVRNDHTFGRKRLYREVITLSLFNVTKQKQLIIVYCYVEIAKVS